MYVKSNLVSYGDLPCVCFGVSNIMAGAISDVLKEDGVFVQSQGLSSFAPVDVWLESSFFPQQRLGHIGMGTFGALVQVLNHGSVIVGAIVIIVLVQRALGPRPMAELGNRPAFGSCSSKTSSIQAAQFCLTHTFLSDLNK